MRINAQLIDGATGDHVWAERYDRDLTDIFAIQDEISKAIVEALKVKLLPKEKKAIEQRGTNSAEAYNFYLLARQYWVTGNHGDPRREERVMRICSRAVEIDPYYADAWALLAIAQSNLRYGFGYEVDDGLAAAHARARDRSVDSRSPLRHGERLEQRARRRGLAELEKGLQRIRLLGAEQSDRQLFLARRGRRSERISKRPLRDGEGLPCLGHADDLPFRARRQGSGARIRADYASASRTGPCPGPSNGAAISFGVSALAALGERDRAMEWMERALLIDPDNLNMRYNFACA